MPVELGPSRRCVVLAEAVRIAPLLGRVAGQVVHLGHAVLRDPRRALGQPEHPARPGAVQRQMRGPFVPVRPIGAEIMVRAAPVVIGGPGSGREHEQDLPLPRLPGWADDDEMVLHEAFAGLAQAGGYDAVEAGALVLRDDPAVHHGPVAAVDIGGGGGGEEGAGQVEGLVRHLGPVAVAVNLDRPCVGIAGAVEFHRLARIIGHAGRVDVDFRQFRILARRVIAVVGKEMFVRMPLAHGPRPDRVGPVFGKAEGGSGHLLSFLGGTGCCLRASRETVTNAESPVDWHHDITETAILPGTSRSSWPNLKKFQKSL